jgi:Cu(I)/Ag(I) efflux system membrane fusion protein/cobalt-zinc-cadmium efflux system membrane fusion protein
MQVMKTKTSIFVALLIIAALVIGFAIGSRSSKPDSGGSSTGESVETREVLYWQAPMNPEEIYDRPGKSAMGMDLIPVYANEGAQEAPAAGEREILYWQAPMNPQEIYDRPGKSAMGMDLIPVYADEAGTRNGGMVQIDPGTVQNMGIRTADVVRMDFSRYIRTVGEVEYDEERLYLVNAKVSGWIESLHVNFIGEEVRTGDPLLEIYSPELVTTQEEYLLAVRNHERISESESPVAHADAEKLLASARTRLEYWDIPESEIERLERSGEVRKTILLLAPATGIVVEKNAIQGAHINAGTDLFQIADLRTVWVHASFYDNEVPWIVQGQPVEMELSYLPGKTYQGRVSYIYPFLREKARDVHARLVFQNPNLDLKPGMYANIRLTGRTIPDALVVPSESVIRSGQRSLVFVDHGQGKFEPREVSLGEVGGVGNTEIRVLGGLLAGERIVTSAQFMLDSESRLQEAIQKMLSARTGSPPTEPEAARRADGVSEMDDESMPGMDPDSMDQDGLDQDGTDQDSLDRPDSTDMNDMDHGSMPGISDGGAAEPDSRDSHDAQRGHSLDKAENRTEAADSNGV